MMNLTAKQQEAINRVYERKVDSLEQAGLLVSKSTSYYDLPPGEKTYRKMTLNEFTATAYPGPGYRDVPADEQPVGSCVMIPWCGMQLGIELDGYTHS